MKLKFSKKYRWIGIGTAVALTTIALGACAPILVSCNDSENINEGPDGGTNNPNTNPQPPKPQIITLRVDAAKLYNTLNGVLTASEWDDESLLEAKIKEGLGAALGSNKSKVTLKKGTLFTLKPTDNNNDGEITFDVKFSSNYKISITHNDDAYVDFDGDIKTFTITNLGMKIEQIETTDIAVNANEIYDALNQKFNRDEWISEIKLVDAINQVFDTAAGSDQDQVDCSIINSPYIPSSDSSNDGSIQFQINADKKFIFQIQNNKNISFDQEKNILTINNLNLFKPEENHDDEVVPPPPPTPPVDTRIPFKTDFFMEAVNRNSKWYNVANWSLQPLRYKKWMSDTINDFLPEASSNQLSNAKVTELGIIPNAKMGESNIGTIKFTVQGDLSNLKFDPNGPLSTEGTNTILIRGNQLNNSYTDIGYFLFTFKNPLSIPSFVTKSALVDTDYATAIEAIDDQELSANRVRNMYQVLIARSLGISQTSIHLDNQRINIGYDFALNIDLNDSICQTLYHKSFNTIKEMFEKSRNYKDLFGGNDSTSPISSIHLSFKFSKCNNTFNDNIMGLYLDQLVTLTFQNNDERTFSINTMTNCFSNMLYEKTVFFVNFTQAPGLKNGDVTKFNIIKVNEEQEAGIKAIVSQNLRDWTKEEVVEITRNGASLPDEPEAVDNPKYVKLINDLNTFFNQNNLDIQVYKVDFLVYYPDNNDNSQTKISPAFFVKDVHSMIEFANPEMYFRQSNYGIDHWYFAYNSNEYWNQVPTDIGHEVWELTTENIEHIKGIVSNIIKQRMTNMIYDLDNDTVKDITIEVNKYIATITDKFYLEPTIWGGSESYVYNDKNYDWRMSFGFFANFRDPELNKTQFIFFKFPKEFDDPDVSNQLYDFYSALVFSNLETRIKPKLMIPREIETNLDQILTNLAATLTTKQSPEEIRDNNPQVIAQINQELAKVDQHLKFKNFYIYGSWSYQDNVNNHRGIRLGIELNNLDEIGYCDQTIGLQSNYFSYSSWYNALIPAKTYETQIKPSFYINAKVQREMEKILKDFAETLTTEETNDELFNNHPDVVLKLNSALAKINNRIKVIGFNVWGGWGVQEYGWDNRDTLKLGLRLSSPKKAGYPDDDVILKSNIAFDFNYYYYSMVTKVPLKTNITANLVINKNVLTNIDNILRGVASRMTTEMSPEELLAAEPNAVARINQELATIDSQLAMTGFNIFGGWADQNNVNNHKGVKLSVTLNDYAIERYGYGNVWPKSNLFTYSPNYNTLVPKDWYETQIKPGFVLTKNVERNLNDILRYFASTLTTRETNEELFNNHQDIVQKLNDQLARINNKVHVVGFNVWGDWDSQSEHDNYKNVRLGIRINDVSEAGYYDNSIFNEARRYFDVNYSYYVLVPKAEYPTRIKAKLIFNNDVATNLERILNNLAATITSEVLPEELIAKNPKVVEDINRELAKVDPRLQMKGFNMWGGWWNQENVNNHKGVKLSITFNDYVLEKYGRNGIILNTGLFTYSPSYNTLIPNKSFETQIKPS